MKRPINPGLHQSGSSRVSFQDDSEPPVDDLRSAIPGGNTVTNDVYLEQRIMLLTGANMSGKSTLMRSVMAVALLGNLGLPVPCKSATVPQVCFCSRSSTCTGTMQAASVVCGFKQGQAGHGLGQGRPVLISVGAMLSSGGDVRIAYSYYHHPSNSYTPAG